MAILIKHNQTTSDPGVSDDETAGYGIFSRWINDTATPTVIALRLRRRFRNAPIKAGIVVELKDEEISTSDIVKLTSSLIQASDGSSVDGQRYQILSKKRKTPGTYEFQIEDTRWLKEYGFIAPAGQANWDSATEVEKAYAYIGDANNQLGTANDTGFSIF